MYSTNPLLLPDFQVEDSWLTQSAARSLTKLRDRFQGQATIFHLMEEESGEGRVRKQGEQGQGQ